MKSIPGCFLLSCLVGWAGLVLPVRSAEKTSPVRISEFLAKNQRGLADEDGDHSGWIELHNASSEIRSLAGWFLTDSPTNLTKWRCPNRSLLPEKYLVLFASGKDRAADGRPLHTNFRLNEAGGYLALVDRQTNIASEFRNYPPQAVDVSFGRVPGEPARVGPFLQPTPGRINAISGPGFAPAVEFSRAGGTFSGAADLRLSCNASGAAIHYTLDGAFPNSQSPVYRAPLALTRTVQVRARAYLPDLLPGPPQSESYLSLDPSLKTFSSNLPILVMDTVGMLDAPSGSLVHLSFFEPVQGRTSLTNLPSFTSRAGYHVRGSSTGGMTKASYLVHLLDEFNEQRRHSALGLPADSDWVLYAPNRYEPVMIHNPFVHQLSRDIGRYSPRTRFLEVFFMNRTGSLSPRDYQGIYVLEEKIKIGKHRVNIDRLGAADLRKPEVTGGYLLKIDRLGPDEEGFWAGNTGLVYVEPKERVITLPERSPQRRFLTAYLTDFDRALAGPHWKDPVSGYRAYIDTESWIDYHVLDVLSGNVDALVYSTYFYKPRNGKLVFGPQWDFDRALGSTDGRDDDPRQWNTGRFFQGPWWRRLFQDPDFWQLWVDRWQQLRQLQFSRAHLNELIDRFTGELREAQPREAERWDLQPRGGTYQSEIDWMKEWLSNRLDFIDGELVSKPRLIVPAGPASAEGPVRLSVPAQATVYYTLDGSDPRLPKGTVSPKARIYSEPIPTKSRSRLFARAYDPSKEQTGGPPVSTPWSGPLVTDLGPPKK